MAHRWRMAHNITSINRVALRAARIIGCALRGISIGIGGALAAGIAARIRRMRPGAARGILSRRRQHRVRAA
jgi:hypothetical protein